MKRGILVTVVLAFFFSGGGTAFAAEDKALILVDDPPSTSLSPSSQHTLANLLGHFDLPYEIRQVDAYARGDMDRYRVTFYLGSAWDRELPAAFLDDAMVTDSRVVWMNFNLWRLGWSDYRQAFEQRFGFNHLEVLSGAFNKVTFAGRTYSRTQDTFSRVEILDTSKAKAVAQVTNGTKAYPYIVQSGNFYFVADDPLAEVTEDSSYMVFCEALHDMTGIPHATSHRALVRIEDIDPTEDPARVRAIADYLSSEGVPFSLAVIPRFSDPLGAWGAPMTRDLNDNPELVSALNYAIAKGGTVVMHGFTHQYGSVANPYNGVTGPDSEFYIQRLDESGGVTDVSPVPEDSTAWVQGRIDSGVEILSRAGFAKPRFWVTPHYLASELDYQVFSGNFGFLYQRFANAHFPYVINRSVYGAAVIPENLGYIDPGTVTPQTLINRADKNLAVRDGFASFFFHSEVSLSYLKTTVKGIKDKGYTFVDVRSLMVTDKLAPVVAYTAPGGILDRPDATISASFTDTEPSSGIDPASARVSIDGAAPLTCAVTGDSISCPVTGVGDGSHSALVSVSDYVGNTGTSTGAFSVDTQAPAVTAISPGGTIHSAEAAIEASLADAVSGIDTASLAVQLDGLPLSCDLDNGHLSCKATGLANGNHSVSISVADRAGNRAATGHSFAVYVCLGQKPALALAASRAYWSSYADYTARTLAVDFSIRHSGSPDALSIAVTESANSDGVMLRQTADSAVDVPAGGSATMTLRYGVPAGVSSFRTYIDITARDVCGNLFVYPATNEGAGSNTVD